MKDRLFKVQLRSGQHLTFSACAWQLQGSFLAFGDSSGQTVAWVLASEVIAITTLPSA